MWPFKKKIENELTSPGSSPGSPLVTVRLDEDDVSNVFAHEVPTEKFLTLKLTRSDQWLHFEDSRGVTRSYDLSSIYDEGLRFVHASVRVGPTFAVQPDAILTKDGADPQHSFRSLDGKGIRFEPFYLPECSGDPADLVGRGLFYRGLHYPGTITPGNVSLLCICDHCRKNFRLQSFHAGFSNLTYLYCSHAPHTLVASEYLEDAPPVLGKADPESVARFESRLPPCRECGGTFQYLNPLRCPHCREPYIDFRRYPEAREQEYYGNCLYGQSPQHWEPGAARKS